VTPVAKRGLASWLSAVSLKLEADTTITDNDCESQRRDGVRESIIHLGVKIDNGLEKLNQGLKKAEKYKNHQTAVRATRPQRREAHVRPVRSRTRLAFLRKSYAATSYVKTTVAFRFCLYR
jgi:hypothetical protein